jgi:starch synthase (maltosyl-transferring)
MMRVVKLETSPPAVGPAPPRVIIEHVSPQVEGGRYPAKGTLGETVVVEADCFADGHDALATLALCRRPGEQGWSELPMEALPNDRWRAEFMPSRLGCYSFTVEAWVEPFATWQRDLKKRVDAGQDVAADLKIGAELVAAATTRAAGSRDESELKSMLRRLRGGPRSRDAAIRAALSPELALLCSRHPDRSSATRYPRTLDVLIEPALARHSTWYECFPRSFGGFEGVRRRVLPYITSMGFDVLYLPPVHPIGLTERKGPNNVVGARPGDPGSPWAIGSREGGHTAIHADLGTVEQFRRLVRDARRNGVEIALDIAFQCSPDHPWVTEHPDWFRHRPDGSIQYAENPPKKYQDIYPLWFETPDWRALWEALRDVIEYWCDLGVRVFRVDNPHTKPFGFWEWLIPELKTRHPEVVLLSEAFTRPKIMYRLAKLGFSQSYTYFAWRYGKRELQDYLTEITTPPVSAFFRPNLWPNTPDILTEQLQHGGRPAFMQRLVLAATLGASYGIYGPAFEQCVNVAVAPGKEEYLDSEKYQPADWDLDRPDSLRDFIARVNRIRRENPALQSNRSLRFIGVDNEQLLAYTKMSPDGENLILTVINLDSFRTQAGMVDVPIHALGIEPGRPYQVHDLIADTRYTWTDWRNYVELNPFVCPAHVFRVLTRVRTERDFEYWM